MAKENLLTLSPDKLKKMLKDNTDVYQKSNNSNNTQNSNTNDDKYITKKIDSALLQLKTIALDGTIYRYIFGKKVLTTVTSFSELSANENTVLLTTERFPGDPNIHYTRNNITVEGTSENNDIDSDFSFTEIGNYSMQGYMFDYQVIPTLNKGPKVVKTFVSPTHLFTIKGYLADDLVKGTDEVSDKLSEKDDLLPKAAHLQATIGTQLEKTITL